MYVQSPLIKKPYEQSEFTHEQLRELKACAQDPIYFAKRYVRVQDQKRGPIPFDPFPYQLRMLEDFKSQRWNIVMASRQMGKTTVIAIYLLWFAMFHFDKNVLVTSRRNSDAMDVMRRIQYAYEELPNWLRPGCISYTKHTIEFDNGSRVWSETTTENTGRGRSIALLMIDELAFVKKNIQYGMWNSLLPTLSTGGQLIISSTPNGDNELFAQLWRGAMLGDNGFNAIRCHWTERPDWMGSDRGESFKKVMKSKMTDVQWAQDYDLEMVSSDPLLINSLVLQGLKGAQPLYTDHGFAFWKDPRPGRTYLVGCDIADGVLQNYSTVEVYEQGGKDEPLLTQVAEFRSNKVKEDQLYAALKWILIHLLSFKDRNGQPPTVYWSFENNSIGAAVGTLYGNDEKFPEAAELISQHGSARYGFQTNGKTKIIGCRMLKKLVERATGKGMVIFSPLLIEELKNYVSTGSAYAAKEMATDDLISATLIVMHIVKQLSEYEPEIFNKIYSSDAEFYGEDVNDQFGDEPVPFAVV